MRISALLGNSNLFGFCETASDAVDDPDQKGDIRVVRWMIATQSRPPNRKSRMSPFSRHASSPPSETRMGVNYRIAPTRSPATNSFQNSQRLGCSTGALPVTARKSPRNRGSGFTRLSSRGASRIEGCVGATGSLACRAGDATALFKLGKVVGDSGSGLERPGRCRKVTQNRGLLRSDRVAGLSRGQCDCFVRLGQGGRRQRTWTGATRTLGKGLARSCVVSERPGRRPACAAACLP